MHEIFVQVCEFHPLAATGAPLPSLSNHLVSLSLSHALQINVDVPGTKFQRVVLSVVQHEQYVKKKKKKQEE